MLLCPGSNLPCKRPVLLLHYYDKKLSTRVQPNNCTNSNSPAVFVCFKHYSLGEQREISIHCQGSELDRVVEALFPPLQEGVGLRFRWHRFITRSAALKRKCYLSSYLGVSNTYLTTLKAGAHVQAWPPVESCFPVDVAVSGFLIVWVGLMWR